MTKIQRAISRFCAKLRPSPWSTPFAGEYEALCFAMYIIFINSAYNGCIYNLHIKDVRKINISSYRSRISNTDNLYIDIHTDQHVHSYTLRFCEYKAVRRLNYPYNIGMKRNHDFRMLYNLLVGVN